MGRWPPLLGTHTKPVGGKQRFSEWSARLAWSTKVSERWDVWGLCGPPSESVGCRGLPSPWGDRGEWPRAGAPRAWGVPSFRAGRGLAACPGLLGKLLSSVRHRKPLPGFILSRLTGYQLAMGGALAPRGTDCRGSRPCHVPAAGTSGGRSSSRRVHWVPPGGPRSPV